MSFSGSYLPILGAVDKWDYPHPVWNPEKEWHNPVSYPAYGISLRPEPWMKPVDVATNKDTFYLMLNVSQFNPEEIDVRVVDRKIVVQCKHEEKEDEHGFIEREFTRRYITPQRAELDKIKSTVSPDGTLIIEAPMKPPLTARPVNERIVPITILKSTAVEESSPSEAK